MATTEAAPDVQTDYRDLLRRAINSWRRPATKRSRRCELWSVVGARVGLGSASAWRLCVELGFDPSESVIPPRSGW